jgi:hypothetical protein
VLEQNAPGNLGVVLDPTEAFPAVDDMTFIRWRRRLNENMRGSTFQVGHAPGERQQEAMQYNKKRKISLGRFTY